MASKTRVEGAVRLARAYVDSSNSTFVERELAWATLALARGKADARQAAVGIGLAESRQAASPAEEGSTGV